MVYEAKSNRYEKMKYNYCGKWGLKLPQVSLGLWHNFSDINSYSSGVEMIKTAFNLGITHFDLANNYGPPPGSAETFMGKILKNELKGYRDELIISTKAGYTMWDGPYGDGGSRKYLLSSLDQSLKRMNLDYVDIFYHHRPDENTPIEESMMALHQAVVSGKALYVGLSNYRPKEAKIAIDILKSLGTPCLIHQPRYSMMDRWVEDGLLDLLKEEGVGAITFSPLNKGILTNKYLNGIPKDSRAAGPSAFLKEADITEEIIEKVKMLNDLAINRNQSLAQMALAWNLRKEEVTSVLIGASKTSQIVDSVNALENLYFSLEELQAIDDILNN
ncbi:MAG: L-glyceraldehyde 3-phosphate reductase [Clostridiaceae bacterium]